VEFKSQLPAGTTNEARLTMLKTMAAFATGNGGTILFGVDDDGTVAGLDPTTLDQQRDRLVNMIRTLIVPDPPYNLRIENVYGLVVMALQVQPGAHGAYALFPDKPVLRPPRRDHVPRPRPRGRSGIRPQLTLAAGRVTFPHPQDHVPPRVLRKYADARGRTAVERRLSG
jgi:predicted HTH transcriptional regulator